MSISIYIIYHKPAYLVKSRIMKPLQVGCDLSKFDLPALKDNTGDNISYKNKSYCELTGQYWVWKNESLTDYVGFMHYRRFLDFFPERTDRIVDQNGLVTEDIISHDILARYGLTDYDIERCVSGFDMVLPEPWNVTASGATSVYNQYEMCHYIKDLDLAGEIIYEKFPDYYAHFNKVMHSEEGLFTNIFIFRREIFNEYSTWIFSLLEELENRIDTSSYDELQCRVIGYIAERMLGVFVSKKLAEHKYLKIKYLRRVFFKDTSTSSLCPPLPKTDLQLLRRVSLKWRIASSVWRRLPKRIQRLIFPIATKLDQWL